MKQSTRLTKDIDIIDLIFDKRWTINIPLSNKFTTLNRSQVTQTKLNYNFHFYIENEKKIKLCLKSFNTPLKNIHRLDLEHSVQDNFVKYLEKHRLVGAGLTQSQTPLNQS